MAGTNRLIYVLHTGASRDAMLGNPDFVKLYKSVFGC